MQKTDSYTKVVLTVIAVCLTIITLKHVDIIPNAYAGDNATTLPQLSDGSVDVYIKDFPYETLKVEFDDPSVSIKDFPYENLDINLAQIGGFSAGSGKLKVEVEE